MQNPNQPKDQPTLTLTNTPEYRDGYANSVQVRMSVWDFFLVFGTMRQDNPRSAQRQKLPGHLPQPPAGQGPLERPRPQPRPVREDLRHPRPRAAPTHRRPRQLKRANPRHPKRRRTATPRRHPPLDALPALLRRRLPLSLHASSASPTSGTKPATTSPPPGTSSAPAPSSPKPPSPTPTRRCPPSSSPPGGISPDSSSAEPAPSSAWSAAAALLAVYRTRPQSRRHRRRRRHHHPHRHLPHLVRAKHPRPRRHLRRRLHPLGTLLLPRTQPIRQHHRKPLHQLNSDRTPLLPRRALQRNRHRHTRCSRPLGNQPPRPQPQQRTRKQSPPQLDPRTHPHPSSPSSPGTPITTTAPASSSATPSTSATTPPPTSTPTASLLCLWHRLLHLTTHMNMFVPVVCAIAVAFIPVSSDSPPSIPKPQLKAIAVSPPRQLDRLLRPRRSAPHPLSPAALSAHPAHLRSHLASSSPPKVAALAALTAAAFLAGIWINPPYAFAPEDNLTYRDMIVLHQHAVRYHRPALPSSHRPHRMARHLRAHPPRARLHQPPRQDLPIQNFSLEEIQKAAAEPGTTTPPSSSPPSGNHPTTASTSARGNEPTDTKYFDFHHDLSPAEAAALLHGEVVWQAHRQGEWAAVLHFPRIVEARDSLPPSPSPTPLYSYL